MSHPNPLTSYGDEISNYLSKIGKKGGSMKSAAKSKASRKNGKKGGRPKKNQESTEKDKGI